MEAHLIRGMNPIMCMNIHTNALVLCSSISSHRCPVSSRQNSVGSPDSFGNLYSSVWIRMCRHRTTCNVTTDVIRVWSYFCTLMSRHGDDLLYRLFYFRCCNGLLVPDAHAVLGSEKRGQLVRHNVVCVWLYSPPKASNN